MWTRVTIVGCRKRLHRIRGDDGSETGGGRGYKLRVMWAQVKCL